MLKGELHTRLDDFDKPLMTKENNIITTIYFNKKL